MGRTVIFTAAENRFLFKPHPAGDSQRLRAVPATGARCVRGIEAAAWSFCALPENLKSDLGFISRAPGYRSTEDMLRNRPAIGTPDLKLNEVCAADIDYATKLRAALAFALSQQTNLEITSAEIEMAAVREFQNQFGYSITPRHVRNLIKRTLSRDGGLEIYERLQLYLPDHPRRKEAKPSRAISAPGAEFAVLKSYIEDLPNPNQADREDMEIIWDHAWDVRAQLIANGLGEKKASRDVREFLASHAGFLAPSLDALLKAFNRKLDASIKGDPFDKRVNNTGNDGSFSRIGIKIFW